MSGSRTARMVWASLAFLLALRDHHGCRQISSPMMATRTMTTMKSRCLLRSPIERHWSRRCRARATSY